MPGAEPSPSLIPPLPPRPQGRSSTQVFLTSLHAFLLRELKNQFGRSRLGYFWALAEPAATVAVLTILHAMLGGGGRLIYGESPVVFFVFGAVPYFMFANAMTQAQGICIGHKGLFNYRQIKPIDIILARCMIDGLMMSGVLLSFLVGWWWFGNELKIHKPLELLLALFSLFSLGFSLGLVFEVFGTVFPDLRKIFAIITRPMFFISGLFFSIGMIPSNFQHYLIWNPILHGVDLARDAVLAGYDSPASWAYVWASVLLLQFLGLAAYRRYLFQLI